MIIKSVIIEDEIPSRLLLKKFLADYTSGIEIVGESATVKEGVELIKKIQPDLIFLDIQLKDGDGFEILDHFKESSFLIVFLTGFKKYGIKAIKYSAFDYLLKPLMISELVLVVEKAKERIKDNNILQPIKEGDSEQIYNNSKLIIKTDKETKVIDFIDILYLKAFGNYTKIFLSDNSTILAPRSLKAHLTIVPNYFHQVHKSYIVNLFKVEKWEGVRSGTITLCKTQIIPFSSRRKKSFLTNLSNIMSR